MIKNGPDIQTIRMDIGLFALIDVNVAKLFSKTCFMFSVLAYILNRKGK